MAAEWEKLTGRESNENAMRQRAYKLGVSIAKPNRVRDRYIPWAVEARHLNDYFHKRLLIASRVHDAVGSLPTDAELDKIIAGKQELPGGEKISEVSWKRLRDLRATLAEAEADGGRPVSIGYNPDYDSGYALVWRETKRTGGEDYEAGRGIWIRPPSSD